MMIWAIIATAAAIAGWLMWGYVRWKYWIALFVIKKYLLSDDDTLLERVKLELELRRPIPKIKREVPN